LERVIGHIDLDYFYAQVEEVENPSLRERPVIVCVFSGRTEDSGVVSTANYRARELGVHSGMPIVLAKKKLEGINAAVVKMDHVKYEVVSSRIMEDIAQKVDVLEPTGIDEAFFDLTASTGGDYAKAKKTAEAMKESILTNEHLTCSVGLGRSKVVAKLGSDITKPGGLKVVKPETTMVFLSPLPVTKLYGVGPKTAATLEDIGIKTVADLTKTDLSKLDPRLGRKFAVYLLAAAKGEDDDPVRAGLEPTQFSRIVTLKHDTRDPKEAFDQLAGGIDYVHGKLESSGKSFRTVTAIGILSDLSTRTKSKTFETPVNDATILRESASELFNELSGMVDKDFRRVGLRVSGFSSVEDQTSLSEFLHPVR
jgi:DNA polymerase IV (DinB-like DNA polymerase)